MGNLKLLKEYPIGLFNEIESFITESIIKIQQWNYKSEIIILLPNHYKFLLKEYLYSKSYIDFPINDNIDEIKWQGRKMLFLSPENKLYVYYKDFALLMPEKQKENRFEMQLP